MLNKLVVLAVLSVVCMAQDYEDYQPQVRQQQQPQGASRYVTEAPKTEAPIAILKQINKHNEDGSYTYGYEGADGSFKIETKAANGEVKGKYGYVDGDGKQRVVEYGANKYGFQPSGEGITVAPINYKEADYEEEQRQYASQQKQAPKAPRPQSFNYPPPQVVEKRKPTYAPAPPPQAPPAYYDYEEEVQTTQRPVQIARPKYTAPSVSSNRPASFPSFDDFFAPAQQAAPVKPAPQYQQYDTRQPQQFPAEPAAPAPAPDSRADQFALFSPAARADSYKPKYAQYEQEQFQYAPQSAQPQPAALRPAFASKPAQGRSTSVLDQLAKDPQYVLPQSSPALHDISFGYSV